MLNKRNLTYFLSLLILANVANAQIPGEVARLSYISGPVSFSPSGENEWIDAMYNRPLVTGDRLWADTNALAELQLGTATLRLGSSTSVAILNLDKDVGQFQLSLGTLYLRVWSIREGQVFEVDTPSVAFSINQPGEYRIDVDADGNLTTVNLYDGSGEINGTNLNFLMDTPSSCRFYGDNSSDNECTSLAAYDDFDQWSFKRDRRMENRISERYLSRNIIGYEDLDNYGTWQTTENYGDVWVPSNVDQDWAPYRDGHWSWISPWGWTWIDDQQWGFAPSHYGRWVKVDRSWCWVPPRNQAALYSPALVVFITGNNEIAWFPIGPGEIYIPPYFVSRDYFLNINITNTTVNETYIANVYKNKNSFNNYINKRVPNALTAVPKKIFEQSQEVRKATVRMSKEEIDKAKVTHTAVVAPISASVIGEAKSTKTRPPENVLNRHITAKTIPPTTSGQIKVLRPSQPVKSAVEMMHPTVSPVSPLPRGLHEKEIRRPMKVPPQPEFRERQFVPSEEVPHPPEPRNRREEQRRNEEFRPPVELQHQPEFRIQREQQIPREVVQPQVVSPSPRGEVAAPPAMIEGKSQRQQGQPESNPRKAMPKREWQGQKDEHQN